MRVKSTRLNDVIETAILFLYLPIQPNHSFPSVVQHPFTNAPISALNVDGSMRMLDLMKPNDLQLWQKEMEKTFAKSQIQCFCLVEFPKDTDWHSSSM